jgi:hypothetical protein
MVNATTTAAASSNNNTGAPGTCPNNPCLNQQLCLLINNAPTYFCNAGFLPPLCASSTNTTTSSNPLTTTPAGFGQCVSTANPCLNNQLCILISNQPVCFCGFGFEPPTCTPTNSTATSTTTALSSIL